MSIILLKGCSGRLVFVNPLFHFVSRLITDQLVLGGCMAFDLILLSEAFYWVSDDAFGDALTPPYFSFLCNLYLILITFIKSLLLI